LFEFSRLNRYHYEQSSIEEKKHNFLENGSSDSFIQGQLWESLSIEITVEEIQSILDNNWFLVVLAPTIDDNLYAGQLNSFRIARSMEEVHALTRGRNWNTAHVVSALKLRGTSDILLNIPVDILSASDRLFVETSEGKILIDTGAPDSQIFKRQDPKKDYSNLPTTSRWSLLLGREIHEVSQKSLNRVTFHLGDVNVTSPTVTFNFHDQALERFQTKEAGCIGILGLDVIKQCDFVWLSEGLILMPSQSEKKVY
jgi:hypothetical protein